MCVDRRGRSARIFPGVAALALVFASLAGAAYAQPASGSTIDDRFRTTSGLAPSASSEEEALLTGRSDLILLRPARLFAVHGSINVSNTDNATLSPDNPHSDSFTVANLGLRAGTRIGGTVDVFADIAVVGSRYRALGALDYSALTGAIGAQSRLGRAVTITASYQHSVVYDRGFSNRQLTQDRLMFTAAAPMRIKGWTVEPDLTAERIRADPSDFTNTAFGAQLVGSHVVPGIKTVSVFAAVAYERRDYDAYFPDLLGVHRVDNRMQGSVGAQWQVRPEVVIVMRYARQQNRSTSDVNGFTASTGSIDLSARRRF